MWGSGSLLTIAMSQSLHKLFKQKKCNSLVHAVIKRDKRGEVTWPWARKRVNNNMLKQLFCENLKPIYFLQMFFLKIVFDKICHAIEWKGVESTKTWTDCIEKCIFCTIYFPFSHDGVSCIITARPGPITRCSQPWLTQLLHRAPSAPDRPTALSPRFITFLHTNI